MAASAPPLSLSRIAGSIFAPGRLRQPSAAHVGSCPSRPQRSHSGTSRWALSFQNRHRATLAGAANAPTVCSAACLIVPSAVTSGARAHPPPRPARWARGMVRSQLSKSPTVPLSTPYIPCLRSGRYKRPLVPSPDRLFHHRLQQTLSQDTISHCLRL